MNICTPDGLELRTYQATGALHLVRHPACLLADEPGLGKTIQVAAALNLAHPGVKVFIGCPETLMINWMRELSKWLTPARSIGLATAKSWPSSDIVIANYDIFPRVETHLGQTRWNIAVLDEAHRIKDPKTQRTKAAGLINAYHLWALTGTPILNKPIEAWTLLWWLLRGQVMPYGEYAQRFCNAFLRDIWTKVLNKQTKQMEAKKRKVWDVSGASNLDELRAYLLGAANMLRRRKADVLADLPPKTHQVIELNAERVRRLIKREASVAERIGGYAEALARLQKGEQIAFEDWTDVRHELGLA